MVIRCCEYSWKYGYLMIFPVTQDVYDLDRFKESKAVESLYQIEPSIFEFHF